MTSLLSIKKRAEDIHKMYDEDPRNQTFNCIIHGPIKTGKTSLLKTCPQPVLVHSFDPAGTDVLKDMIKKREILADTRFEAEDPYKPKAFKTWKDEFDNLYNKKFFDHVGTFAIDSMTTWAQTIMYEVVKNAAQSPKGRKAGRIAGEAPRKQDWMHQMAYIENYIRKFLSLPCHCILLGHSDQPTDDEGNAIGDLGIMITGKLRERIPALFSEIYYLKIKDYKKETRELLTKPTYGIQAGTRLGNNGKLDAKEPPDLGAIMKKVGLDITNKPLFHELSTIEEEI